MNNFVLLVEIVDENYPIQTNHKVFVVGHVRMTRLDPMGLLWNANGLLKSGSLIDPIAVSFLTEVTSAKLLSFRIWNVHPGF
jgi:hypothetical protein